MENIFDGLNKEQKEAVLHITSPLRILAGAGTGKTKVLTHKIAYLVENGYNPARILAVTFTNKAAAEMKERVSKLMGEINANKSVLSTYHSLCVRILREDSNVIGIDNRFNILDSIDQRQILKHIYKRYGITNKTIRYSNMVAYISNNKSNLIDSLKLISEAKSDAEKLKSKIYRDYEAEISRTGSLDFDDLLIKTYQLFKKHDEAREKWSKRFDYILVDEFQDTSWIQYEIIKFLGQHENLTIVGDPDQTIYTWRGASVDLILDFDKKHKNTKTVILIENYRSTQNILNLANKLIDNNKNRLPKDLKSNKSIGLPAEFHFAASDYLEAAWVAKKILALQKSRVQTKNITILYRANYLSRILEQSLIVSNIPYKIYGDVKFYERQEIKDAIAFLKVIHNGDAIAFRRIINVPSRKIGKTSIDKLDKFAESKNKTLFKTIKENADEIPLPPNQRNSLNILFNLFDKYHKELKKNSISLVISKFLMEVGYSENLRSFNEQSRIDNMNELFRTIKSWEKKNPEETVDKYLEEISLLSSQDGIEDVRSYVTMMTIHTSKGLEFENLFVFGFSEGVFPSEKSSIAGAKIIEEERRLAYVAVTRAREKLYLSGSAGYTYSGELKAPSRFIAEMGIDISLHSNVDIGLSTFENNYDYEVNKTLKVSDEVEHISFGKGIIYKIEGEMAEIAFEHPHGKKWMMKDHKSLKKV